jgi:hypothetical protein
MGDRPAPRYASLLGYLGLLPFAAGGLGVWLAPAATAALAGRALVAYAAVILSFMGAVHWGLAMHASHPGRDRQLAWSVVPALIAWIALLLPALVALPLLLVSFAVLNAADRGAARAGAAPGWYPELRLPLTIGVVVCLGLAWLRVVLD